MLLYVRILLFLVGFLVSFEAFVAVLCVSLDQVVQCHLLCDLGDFEVLLGSSCRCWLITQVPQRVGSGVLPMGQYGLCVVELFLQLSRSSVHLLNMLLVDAFQCAVVLL